MHTYREIPLGVECAWPASDNRQRGEGANKIFARILAPLMSGLRWPGSETTDPSSSISPVRRARHDRSTTRP